MSASKPDRTWITGVGTASPLGMNYAELAENLLDGRSGITRVERFNAADHPSKIAGQLGEVRCPPGLDAEPFAKLHRLEQLALWCCVTALQDADCWDRRQEMRVGVVMGLGAEWLSIWEEDHFAGGTKVHRPDNEALLVEWVAARLDLSGPVTSLAAACASGNHALAVARNWLRRGLVDVCLAGAVDTAVSPLGMAAFGNLRALSRRDDPRGASRPFDRDRDGFVMSEGGAMMVVERASGARKRGARSRGEFAGFGATSDAHHLVIPSPDPEPAASAMRTALAEARVRADEVDYVNAHATSTPVGDASEARVLRAVLGEAVTATPVSSTKSMTGHLLTAAAALEAVACLVALDRQALPPTINLDNPDPECHLCHVANHAWSRRVAVAVSNSFGFGGSNTCAVFRAA
jgi:3-oxoacyl-[acyl-carrier-protein] synthase II